MTVFAGVTALVLTAAGLTGCGGTGGTGLIHPTPDTAPPVVTRVGTGITTTPRQLSQQGGIADILVDINDAAGVNTDSVKIDVVNQAGISLLRGAQPMISLNSVQNRWGYQMTLPPNSNNFADDAYRVTVTAADTHGNRVTPAFVVGTIRVPNR